MANVEALTREELDDFEPVWKAVERSMGFVPRSMYTMARRPEILRGFMALGSAVLGPGTVDAGLKQLVANVASNAAGCRYCQAHTAASAHRAGVEADKVAHAFEFEHDRRFSEAERAALRLARDAALQPNATTPAHFAELRCHYSEEQIVEITAVISLFGYLNRWNDTMATDLEEEPLQFGQAHLAAVGWEPGKHA